MTTDTEVLRQKNPAEAEWVESWRKRFERNYDLTKAEDQATFYEGMAEMGRHLASIYGWGRLGVGLTTSGIGEVSASVVPRQ